MSALFPRAVFFDRDGVVNVSPGPGYVTSVREFVFMPGIVSILSWCRAQGFKTVLVTSQQGVGKGLMTPSALDEIHSHMQRELRLHGAFFDSIQACTGLDGQCDCRKPAPKMVFDAAAELGGLDLAGSALVGDHDRDIVMARNAGVGFAIRLAGENVVKEEGDFLAHSLEEVFAALQNWHTTRP
ncbi:MAG: HAD-IIIA family hydrolase [Verrucomicrobiaceae bacterium]|nr:MAG: HAD-IIIA family hydrolase [Verrucomicrobiaceae bacterium]